MQHRVVLALAVIVIVAVGCAPSGPLPGGPAHEPSTATPRPTRGIVDAEQAAALYLAYGRDHPDEFGGLYLDEGNRLIVLLFTDNLVEHERALRSLASPDVELEVRRVDHTERELTAVMDELSAMQDELAASGIEIVSLGVDTIANEVGVEAKSDDPDAEQTLEGLYPGIVDATVHPLPGAWTHVEAGEGWRLVAAGETDPAAAYTVDAVVDAAGGELLWHGAGLEGSLPPVDWEQEIVVSFIEGISRSCPERRLDDVVIDRGAREVYSVTSDPLEPRVCTLDLSGGYAYVVALDRAALPESPFTLKLNERAQSCPDCGTQQVIEVSVP